MNRTQVTNVICSLNAKITDKLPTTEDLIEREEMLEDEEYIEDECEDDIEANVL